MTCYCQVERGYRYKYIYLKCLICKGSAWGEEREKSQFYQNHI